MAAAAIGSGICIWVKPDPFQLGILPVAPHPKLSLKVRLSYIRNIAELRNSI